MMAGKREKLIELVTEYAYESGSFELASGQQATYYIDGKHVTLRGEFLQTLGEVLVDMAIEDDADAIGGMSIGADPIAAAATMIAFQRGMDITGFLVRKEPKTHGTQKYIEGPCVDGKRVIIVDDVVTTGGSIMEAYNRVIEAGAKVTRLTCIVDRGPGSKKKNLKPSVPYKPILTIGDVELYREQRHGSERLRTTAGR